MIIPNDNDFFLFLPLFQPPTSHLNLGMMTSRGNYPQVATFHHVFRLVNVNFRETLLGDLDVH